MPKHVAFSGLYSNTDFQTIGSVNTINTELAEPPVFPYKLLHSPHEPNNFTLTVNDGANTRLRWRNPTSPSFDAGSNLIKFPYKGIYHIYVYITYQQEVTGLNMLVRLRDTITLATTPVQTIRVGGALTDMRPFLYTATWVCNNTNDRVEIVASGSGGNVSQVGLVEGAVYAVQTFA